MKRNHTGHSKAILAAAVALVALLVVPSLAHALKLPITGGTASICAPTCIPLWPYATAMGSATVVTHIGKVTVLPAQLTLPIGVIGAPYTYEVLYPLATPPYIHLITNLNISAPIGSPAVFKAGPKPTRPAAFNFCPGGANNPSCLTAASGTKPGIVKYTPGVKQFGGTMKVFAHGYAEIALYLGYTNPTIAHFNLVNTATGPVGQTYGKTVYFSSPSAAVTTGAVMAKRMIQQPGNWVYSIPGYTARYTGFPWTTGKVAIQVLHAPPTYPNSTYTTTGYDNRTLGGRGNIMMVAGGLSHSSANTLSLRQFFKITVVPEPVLLLQLASGLLGLAIIEKRRRRANR